MIEIDTTLDDVLLSDCAGEPLPVLAFAVDHALEQFWRRAGRASTWVARRDLLMRWATFICGPAIPRKDVEGSRRERFLAGGCWICRGTAVEVHHIVAVAQGGPTVDRNLVALCAWCHDGIHGWGCA